ncbi:hypothetical protein Taro_044891 [Colocasia esculenta]|uniref:Uncharacterized protein n=1 Tax=Colocasia esculenta TaxID=4460 RepID=A0A843WPU8_COLES|nr:hypothetical protein [Colocasia esculenta]
MNITREEAKASNLVVGTVPILGRFARVLIDPGATHYFASEEFFGSLTEFAPEQTCDLVVKLPTRTTFSCKGSLDTTISGVDTMAQRKDRNVKKRSTSVDTSLGQKQLDHLKEADQVEADFCEEFKEDPEDQKCRASPRNFQRSKTFTIRPSTREYIWREKLSIQFSSSFFSSE